MLKTVPTRRPNNVQPVLIATLQLQVCTENQERTPEANLVSRLTDQTMECVVTEQSNGVYEISCQPTVGGVYQLHVKVGGKEVRGSPLSVTVKTPIDKLGSVIKTIHGVHKPWGVAVNKSGEVIVAEAESGCVLIFNAMGDKIKTLDTQGTAVGGMKKLLGVTGDNEDNILVIDVGNCRLLKLSREGDLITAVGSKGSGPGQFTWPMGVHVNDSIGKVYVVDGLAHCVHILNSDLTFFSKFGSLGTGDGQFNSPRDITSDSTGCEYVTDHFNSRVQVFTSDGEYLRQFGKKGKGSGELYGPVGISIDDDVLYVADNMNHCVSMFTTNGEFVKSFGSKGSGPREFSGSFRLALFNGVVYVSDFRNDRIDLF